MLRQGKLEVPGCLDAPEIILICDLGKGYMKAQLPCLRLDTSEYS